jgi:hypothetical protein
VCDGGRRFEFTGNYVIGAFSRNILLDIAECVKGFSRIRESVVSHSAALSGNREGGTGERAVNERETLSNSNTIEAACCCYEVQLRHFKSRLHRHRTQITIPEPRIRQRMRLVRVLFGLYDQPPGIPRLA